MLCVDVAQAETMATFGPVSLRRMLICPEIMLLIEPGMKNGDTLRTPPASKRL